MEEELNNKWNIHKVVQEAMRTAHIEPSPQTLLELSNLKKDMASNNEAHKLIMDKIDKFGEKLEQLSVDIAKLPEAIFEKGDERYATKLSEKVVYGMVGVVVTGVLVALMTLLMK